MEPNLQACCFGVIVLQMWPKHDSTCSNAHQDLNRVLKSLAFTSCALGSCLYPDKHNIKIEEPPHTERHVHDAWNLNT